MSFPKIANQEIIVFPELDTFGKIVEAEEAFDQWILGAYRDG